MKDTKQKNIAIREALKRNGLFLWNLEDLLGVSCMTITRMMRHELSQDEQKRIIKLIEKEAKRHEKK